MRLPNKIKLLPTSYSHGVHTYLGYTYAMTLLIESSTIMVFTRMYLGYA